MSVYAGIPGIGDHFGDDPTVLIDPAQARFLAEQLSTWADRAEGEQP
jgi:hypothetical protein